MKHSYRKMSDEHLVNEYWCLVEELTELEDCTFYDDEVDEYGMHEVEIVKLISCTALMEVEARKRGINLYSYFS